MKRRIRALARFHADHPYIVHVEGQEYRVKSLPAESDTGMFEGNSMAITSLNIVQRLGGPT